jgi:hypothetical protein
VTRPAYRLLLGVALVMGLLAVLAAVVFQEPLHDPDGFLGPSWVRLPLMLVGAFVVDVVPRALWRGRGRLSSFKEHLRAVVHGHWTRDRITLVVMGLVCFYVTYVSYRNLKNDLPHVYSTTQDATLHSVDRALAFGHEPAVLLHQMLGETVAAQVLAVVYLLFLPVAPVSVVAWVVWSRNISYGYWYATANCLAWALGTASYYLVPSLGPNFAYPWLYVDLKPTGVNAMQDALWNSHSDVYWNPLSGSLQSVAGFASLHIGILLTLALVMHYTVRHRWICNLMWVYLALTLVSTLYFGWHYIADDIAGAVIAVVAVWLAGIATGQKFQRHGRASRPTTTTAQVPVRQEGLEVV